MATTPELLNLFNGFMNHANGLFIWRIYTISLFGGGVIRFADADFDIVGVSQSPLVNGFTYRSSTVKVDAAQSKTQVRLKIGLDSDTYVLVVIARPFDPVTGAPFPDQIGNVPWIQAADNGALDSADFQVDEAYFGTLPTWPMPPAGAAPVGCKTIFAGVVAEVDTAPPLAAITVNDYRYLMSLPMPRHAWQGQCRWTLFGPGCNTDGLNAATYAINGTVAAGSTGSTIIGAGLPVPQGSRTYKQGRIVMTSGLNNTFQRTIKDWDGAFTLSLLNPFPFMVAAGDTFVAYPGCNKARDSAQGCAGFGNQANHGGFDFIPPPEVQVG